MRVEKTRKRRKAESGKLRQRSNVEGSERTIIGISGRLTRKQTTANKKDISKVRENFIALYGQGKISNNP